MNDDDRMGQLAYEGIVFTLGGFLAAVSGALGLNVVTTMALVILCACVTVLVLFRLGAG